MAELGIISGMLDSLRNNETLLNKHKSFNKKFLETDYPRGRAIEVFRRFHFGLGAKNRPEYSGLYFAPPGIAKRQFRPPQREV